MENRLALEVLRDRAALCSKKIRLSSTIHNGLAIPIPEKQAECRLAQILRNNYFEQINRQVDVICEKYWEDREVEWNEKFEAKMRKLKQNPNHKYARA